MKTDPDCIFCKIIAGKIPSYKVYEDDKYIGMLDISQFVEGHTIVIPKAHIVNIWEHPDIGEYYEVVQKIGNHFIEKIGYKYADTLTFGRLVLHSHVHIVPHNGDDKGWEKALTVIGGYQQDKSRWPSKDEGERIAKKFRVG